MKIKANVFFSCGSGKVPPLLLSSRSKVSPGSNVYSHLSLCQVFTVKVAPSNGRVKERKWEKCGCESKLVVRPPFKLTLVRCSNNSLQSCILSCEIARAPAGDHLAGWRKVTAVRCLDEKRARTPILRSSESKTFSAPKILSQQLHWKTRQAEKIESLGPRCIWQIHYRSLFSLRFPIWAFVFSAERERAKIERVCLHTTSAL